MKYLIIFFICYINIYPLKSVEFRIENDLFIADGFYTSGISWKYTQFESETLWQNGKSTKLKNLVFGQKIFTPSDITIPVEEIELYDRPYAGWLYIGFEEEIAYLDYSRLKYSVHVGFTGKYSLAENSQALVHYIVGSAIARGWSTQIEETLGVQFNISYQQKNFEKQAVKNTQLEGYFKTEYEIGNIFLNMTASQHIRWGRINEFLYTDCYNLPSYFLYFEPKLKFNFYDATIEGAMFSDDSIYTMDIRPMVAKVEGGFILRQKRFKIDYSLNIHSNELKNLEWKLRECIYHSLAFVIFF